MDVTSARGCIARGRHSDINVPYSCDHVIIWDMGVAYLLPYCYTTEHSHRGHFAKVTGHLQISSVVMLSQDGSRL